MTYINLVNNILKRLRDNTVSTVVETNYAELIGVFINDAKQEIEDAWSWSGLRTTLTATTSLDVFNYELNGSQNKLTVLDVVNNTDNTFLEYKTAHEMNALFLNNDPQKGSPRYYSFNGISTDGDTQVDLYPIPNDTYVIRFNVIQRTGDLVENDDSPLIPTQPILHLAYAKALEERGEDGGMSPVSAYATAQRTLSDAIALDAAKSPEETVWYTV